MAKMFYSIEEAAEKLGVSEERVRGLAASGRLQQFRDRDKLMFKRDQVDSLAASSASKFQEALDDADASGGIDLADPSETDQLEDPGESAMPAEVPLAASGDSGGPTDPKEDSRMATGISVFDATDDIDTADPLAQTVVADAADEDELALDSVGSGSGLLDLTRESDDTSLGAELLDEIYPGGAGEPSDASLDQPGSSGLMDASMSVQLESGPSGLENLAPGEPYSQAAPTEAVYEEEPYDTVGDIVSSVLLVVALAVGVVGAIVAVSGAVGVQVELTDTLVQDPSTFLYGSAGVGVVMLLLGGAGYAMSGRG